MMTIVRIAPSFRLSITLMNLKYNHQEIIEFFERDEPTFLCLGHENRTDAIRILFPGSFNPLHSGHREMATFAKSQWGARVEFEISIRNVDKNDLTCDEFFDRLSQFDVDDIVWITKAPTFLEKARLFPNCYMIVGADTLVRIADPKYYSRDKTARDRQLQHFDQLGCRFLVFGRTINGAFATLDELQIPNDLKKNAIGISRHAFRMDISSSEVRANQSKTQHPDVDPPID